MNKDKVSLHDPTNRAGTHDATYDPVGNFFVQFCILEHKTQIAQIRFGGRRGVLQTVKYHNSLVRENVCPKVNMN